MKRQILTLRFLVGLCGLIYLAQVGAICSGNESEPKLPNVVWLISEDNSKHYLKLFDSGGVETPNIAKLANEGLLFTRAFSNAPVCSVARTTLFSGCYAPRIGAQFHRRFKPVQLPNALKLFPAYLRKAGYFTANNVKEDFNVVVADDVWDECSRKAHWRNRKKDQPFFYCQSFQQSHEGHLHFQKDDISRTNLTTDPDTVFVAPQHPQSDLFRFTNAYYRDRIQLVDQQIGKVISQLETDGLLESTFVFYFSDHGGVLPGSKGYLFETGLHVPLVIRIPNRFRDQIPAEYVPGNSTPRVVSFVDFAPTVMGLASLPLKQEMDGINFLNPETQDENEGVSIGYADRFDFKNDLVRSIRVGNYKYIRNFQPQRFNGMHNRYRYKMLAYQQWRHWFELGKLNSIQARFFEAKPVEELFNVEDDPYELNNLAQNSAATETLKDLREKLNTHLKQMPDLGFFPENYLIENAFEAPVRFGQQHKKRIDKLIDVANYQLDDFLHVSSKLKAALVDEDAWVRYWALQTCTSKGSEAMELKPMIEKIAQTDSELLNQVAAAEYLAMIGQGVQNIFEQALEKSNSKIEQSLILNSAILVSDAFDQKLSLNIKSPAGKGDAIELGIKQQLDYLNSNRRGD